MALQLNLLHEQILEQRQRQRDPLKIGLLALIGCGAVMFLYYSWSAYRTLEIKSRLNAIERNWAKIEPKVTTAQKRVSELQGIVKTTRSLDDYIENRFFWAPFLQKIARCVAPNAQLTSLEGSVLDDKEKKGVSVTLEGIAAGREPRAAAEDLRQLLLEQLGQSYSEVKVEFKSLEDLDTMATLSGTRMPTARYTLAINFNPAPAPKPTPAATPTRQKKRSDT
jgi:hypothetical protein